MRNRQAKSKVRTAIKKFDAAVQAGNKEEAKAMMDLSFKLLDSTAGKGIIHKNKASGKKSRMYRAFSKIA